MSVPVLSVAEVARALAFRDLTDPREGPHAIQRLVDDVVAALDPRVAMPVGRVPRRARRLGARQLRRARLRRRCGNPRRALHAVRQRPRDVAQPHVGAGAGGAAHARGRRRARRRVGRVPGHRVPARRHRPVAYGHAAPARPVAHDARRRARSGRSQGDDRDRRARAVARCGVARRARVHPYTTDGLQIDVENGDEWVEIGECGLAAVPVLRGAGLDDGWNGLAMGLGLDRVLMLRKGMADIRLLRATDARVASQIRDLSLYRPVSSRPAIVRDLSLAVDAQLDAELLGDRVRAALGDDARDVSRPSRSCQRNAGRCATTRRASVVSVCAPGRRTCCYGSCSVTSSVRSRARKPTRCASASSPFCTPAAAVVSPPRRARAVRPCRLRCAASVSTNSTSRGTL